MRGGVEQALGEGVRLLHIRQHRLERMDGAEYLQR